ncbi:MAG: crotonase/enoyl-CoA hydratase family protein [Parahaliea sp.]
MTPEFETLKLLTEDDIATVSLNRPDKANAMNPAMWQELQDCFEHLDAEPAVRVIILAGEGRHFCSGIDLDMFNGIKGESQDPARRNEYFRRTILRLQNNLSAIEKCRKPVLAAVQKACIGGGVDLTCCCDMRYASADAFFSVREIDIGMTADVGTLQRLPHWIPQGVVRELAYTGRNMDAREAQQLGYVNQVFDDTDTLLSGVREIASAIAAKSPLAIRGTKEQLLYARDHSVNDSLNYMATWNAAMFSDIDIKAGVGAQLQKTVASYED